MKLMLKVIKVYFFCNIYSLHLIKAAIMYLKEIPRRVQPRNWISTNFLVIKWSDLIRIPKLIAYGKQMRVHKSIHDTTNLSGKNRVALFIGREKYNL